MQKNLNDNKHLPGLPVILVVRLSMQLLPGLSHESTAASGKHHSFENQDKSSCLGSHVDENTPNHLLQSTNHINFQIRSKK